MVVIKKIIVDTLPYGCTDCQLYRDQKCYGLIRDDYDAQTEWNYDYRRSDCPMVVKGEPECQY